jgi:hypothetical protein
VLVDSTSSPILDRYFNDVPDDLRRIGSLQSSFEAEMEARSARGRHLPTVVHDEDGRQVASYTGLRCGPVHVRSAAVRSCRPPEYPEDRDPGLRASEFARQVERSLAQLEPRDVLVLRLRFREPLPVSRVAFGRAPPSSWRGALAAGADHRQRERGCGNVAHLADAAHHAYERARTELPFVRWLEHLGTRLVQVNAQGMVQARKGGTSVAARADAAEIARESEALVTVALGRFLRAYPRVPAALRMAA